MELMEHLIHHDYWCLMPATIAYRLRRKDIVISNIESAPPDQKVFYRKRQGPMADSMRLFLHCLHEEISFIKGTTSYLGNL